MMIVHAQQAQGNTTTRVEYTEDSAINSDG